MRHWNNDKRIAISIPKELVSAIQTKDAKADYLVLQGPEARSAEQGDYDAYRIVSVTPAEVEI